MRRHQDKSRIDQGCTEGVGCGLGHILGQRTHQGAASAAREAGDGEAGASRTPASSPHVAPAPPPPLPEWAAGTQPAASAWYQRPPPPRATIGNAEPRWPPMHTPAASVWPPAESLPRPRMREEDGELSTLMRGMMNAQANDSGWPTFSGKYVEYPRFRKEWWAYRQTYHGHVCDELCRYMRYAAASRRKVWPAMSAC